MKKILIVIGTRPEAIKMAPVINEFKKSQIFKPVVCVTGQHREMLYQVLNFFSIKADTDLRVMSENQTLTTVTVKVLEGMEKVIRKVKPDFIAVQGDTTTTFAAGLAAFYSKIPIVHIEAGLRSFNKYSPFPEEGNRKLTGTICDYHFPPTDASKENLKKEGISDNVWTVGNTVIDALFLALKHIEEKNMDQDIYNSLVKLDNNLSELRDALTGQDNEKKIILVTGHRRENFGSGFENICKALKQIASRHRDTAFIYPVHLNPNVQQPVKEILGDTPGIYLIPPVDYPQIVWLMKRVYMVLTDSGGIQEEAPSLGKPVLVLRNVTERMEGVHAGTAKLIGTDYNKIVEETEKLLTDSEAYSRMAHANNPYGNGDTAEKIRNILENI